VEQAARTARRLRFGVYEIDILEGELRKGGTRINLQDQPFQVLVLLLANPGKLVTRQGKRILISQDP
jgi:DNA-binding response OmpR family regulator